MTFVREPTLWPVLVVVIGHVVAFLAPMLLMALRDGSTLAFGALAATLGLTAAGLAAELSHNGRLGALSAVSLCTWLVSGGVAVVADRYGVF